MIVLDYIPVIINDVQIRKFPDELIPIVAPRVVESAKALDAVISPKRDSSDKLIACGGEGICHILNVNSSEHDKAFILELMMKFYRILLSWGWEWKWRDSRGVDLASPLPGMTNGIKRLDIGEFIYCGHYLESMTCLEYHSIEHRAADHEPVILDSTDVNPIVFGRLKEPLTEKQFAVVSALLHAGPQGLSLKELEGISGGARGILNNLRRDPDWGNAIHLPGGPGRRYRIGRLFPDETHTSATKSTLP